MWTWLKSLARLVTQAAICTWLSAAAGPRRENRRRPRRSLMWAFTDRINALMAKRYVGVPIRLIDLQSRCLNFTFSGVDDATGVLARKYGSFIEVYENY